MRHCFYVSVNSCAKKMVSRIISPQPYQAPIHALHTPAHCKLWILISPCQDRFPRCDLHCSICRFRPPLHEGTRMDLVLVFPHVNFLCFWLLIAQNEGRILAKKDVTFVSQQKVEPKGKEKGKKYPHQPPTLLLLFNFCIEDQKAKKKISDQPPFPPLPFLSLFFVSVIY